MAFAKALKEQKLNVYCDFCFRNITLDTYIRCEDCRFDSCLVCFFAEIETREHKNSHDFRIVSNLSKILPNRNWRLIDELLLIDGTIAYGLGNFDDIAKILVPKTAAEVRRHFFELMNTKDNEEGEVPRTEVPKSNPNDSYVLSYMSKRREFDSEILNEYESLIDNLRFEEDDTELETEFKRHMLYHYKTVLKRRKIWRHFVIDRKMTDVKQIKARSALIIGEAPSKFKWLAQFLSRNDFNAFTAGLAKEKQLVHNLSSNPLLSMVNEDELSANSKFLNGKERKLCERLRLDQSTYIKLKKMALEYYVYRKPIKMPFFELFSENDRRRATILYKWFSNQKIVIDE